MKKIVFFGSTDIVIHQMYKDLEKDYEIIYKKGIIQLKSGILKMLFKIHFSVFINNLINLPFKNKWFKLFLEEEKELCESPIFIFTKDNFKYLEYGYAKYLKQKFLTSKIILLFLDIHGLRGYDFSKLEGLYDYAFTFDEEEANKYSILYYPLCYSHSKFENKTKEYDLCFIGQDKGRVSSIHEIYMQAKQMNLSMKVIICGECLEKNKYPEFEFVESIPYEEALEYISKSKFNLEMCLQDTTSISIRLYEAIMFNQELITNNKNIVNSPYYQDDYIHLISFDNVDLSFVKKYKEINRVELKGQISPLKFIEHIKKLGGTYE